MSLNLPPLKLVHPVMPGAVFAVAFTDQQAQTKLAQLNALAPGFEIAENLPTPLPAPTPLQALLEQLIEAKGTNGAINALHDLINPPAAPEVAPVRVAPVAVEPAAAESVQAPEPIVCPFKVGFVVKDKHSGKLVEVTFIFDQGERGDGMEVRPENTNDAHFVPAANYPDFDFVRDGSGKKLAGMPVPVKTRPVRVRPPARKKKIIPSRPKLRKETDPAATAMPKAGTASN